MSDASPWATVAWSFLQQFGWGTLIGVAGGFAMALLLPRLVSRDAGGGGVFLD